MKIRMGIGWDIAREATASLLTYELYPLGLIGRSLPTVPLYTKAAKTANVRKLPVLFIHGVFHNRSTFAWLKQKMTSHGYRHFKEVDLLTSIHPIPRLAEQIASVVSTMQRRYEVPQVDIIAHSLGGMIARYYVQAMGGDGTIKNLITLGSPHAGTMWSNYSMLTHLKDLSPKSPFMEKLCEMPPPQFTRVVAVSGSLDVMVRPKAAGFWPGVRNIQLKRVGHAGLLFSQRVSEIILANLNPGPVESPDVSNVRK